MNKTIIIPPLYDRLWSIRDDMQEEIWKSQKHVTSNFWNLKMWQLHNLHKTYDDVVYTQLMEIRNI